jgi:integral membrane protein
MVSTTGRDRRTSAGARVRAALIAATLRSFQGAAYAEGGLLPAILLVAVIHWLSGVGAGAVAVVGAAHGTAFTAYVALVPCVARVLHWSPRTASVAFCVAFVPFAPWAFERRIHAELIERTRETLHVDTSARPLRPTNRRLPPA